MMLILDETCGFYIHSFYTPVMYNTPLNSHLRGRFLSPESRISERLSELPKGALKQLARAESISTRISASTSLRGHVWGRLNMQKLTLNRSSSNCLTGLLQPTYTPTPMNMNDAKFSAPRSIVRATDISG